MARSERSEGPVLSLMEQLRESYKPDETEAASPGEETNSGVKLYDGYVRLSPVQPYVEGPYYREKRRRTALILCVVMLALAAAWVLVWKLLYPVKRVLAIVILCVLAAALVLLGIAVWILVKGK